MWIENPCSCFLPSHKLLNSWEFTDYAIVAKMDVKLATKEDIGHKTNNLLVSLYKAFVSIPRILGNIDFPRKIGEGRLLKRNTTKIITEILLLIEKEIFSLIGEGGKDPE